MVIIAVFAPSNECNIWRQSRTWSSYDGLPHFPALLPLGAVASLSIAFLIERESVAGSNLRSFAVSSRLPAKATVTYGASLGAPVRCDLRARPFRRGRPRVEAWIDPFVRNDTGWSRSRSWAANSFNQRAVTQAGPSIVKQAISWMKRARFSATGLVASPSKRV